MSVSGKVMSPSCSGVATVWGSEALVPKAEERMLVSITVDDVAFEYLDRLPSIARW